MAMIKSRKAGIAVVIAVAVIAAVALTAALASPLEDARETEPDRNLDASAGSTIGTCSRGLTQF